MLSTQYPSRNKKTGPIATTYRAGAKAFGTCPATCKLCDRPEEATKKIDHEYFKAVYHAVPKGGRAFTYCHFPHKQWANKYPPAKKKTVVNFSADTMRLARASLAAGVPTVVATTQQGHDKAKAQGVKLVICPADKKAGRNCGNCGGNKGPLCSRIDRDYAVVFLVHGTSKAKAADTKTPGGCYAESGYYTRIHWNQLSQRSQGESDSLAISSFVKELPYGTTLRHHIAGDMGKM